MSHDHITIQFPATGLENFIREQVSQAIQSTAKADTPAREFCSQKELSARIGLSVPTVMDLRKKGIIPGVLIGNKWRFEVSEVWQALRDHQAKQNTPAQHRKRGQ